MVTQHEQPDAFILGIIRDHGCRVIECTAAKSAQHAVWILTVSSLLTSNDSSSCTIFPPLWKSCLDRGGNRLVVRIWKGQCRWWNLNHPRNDKDSIARQELWGYETARMAFEDQSSTTMMMIRIPTILYRGTNHDQQEFAILENVGEHSTLFDSNNTATNMMLQHEMDTSWADSMIKLRHEFGFDEPHPRWGRVPAETAVDYAMQILNQVILPLHRACNKLRKEQATAGMPIGPIGSTSSWTFERVEALHQTKFTNFIAPIINNGADAKMLQAVSALKTALLDNRHTHPSPLAPVLVHLDLQPQNILFRRQLHNTTRQNEVVSVLDWEEAAWADPRFELLLLGRKVCANRHQAELLWNYYQEQTCLELGSITLWLRLETMHSLTTLLLQATTGSGRSPWEAKPDLWGKIEREMARLDGYYRDDSS